MSLTTTPLATKTAAAIGSIGKLPAKATAIVEQSSSSPYVPSDVITSISMDRRIAIMGAPGSGKTTSILTFPNRTWLDFDHKLPEGEQCVPFWDSKFVDSICPRTYSDLPNRRDATKIWLRKNIAKFAANQTVIVDSGTMLENAFDAQTAAEDDHLEKANAYWFWQQKKRYYRELFDFFRDCKCLIVFTFHEVMDRDEKGELNGKVRPLMDGGFKDQLLGQFTDVWRMKANVFERSENGNIKRDANNQKLIKKLDHNGNPNWVWFWQLLGDTEFDTNCNPTLGAKCRAKNIGIIPADYNEILKIYSMP